MIPKPKDRSRERRGLVARLDSTFSLKIRLRAKKEFKGLCQFCYLRGLAPKPIAQCFHFLTRMVYATRWDPGGSEGSCAGCNLVYEHDAGFVGKVRDWYWQVRGKKKWEELGKRHHSIAKFSNEDLREMLNTMRGEP